MKTTDDKSILSALEPSPSGWDAGAEAMREACAQHMADFAGGESIWHQVMRGDADGAAYTIRALPLPTPAGEG